MAEAIFEARRLEQRNYDLRRPLERARLQKTVRDFMDLLRNNAFNGRETSHVSLVTAFCRLLDHDDVWYLAETVVPEVRVALADQLRLRFFPIL